MSGATLTLWTVGHSNHDLETFVGLVQGSGVEVVVDVRSVPRSRYSPHFNREALRASLERAGIGYRYLGGALGGRPEGDELYDTDGRVRYDLVARTDGFRQGLERLLEEVSRSMSSVPASRLPGMEPERVAVSTTIEAAPEAVFAVLADPSAHADIDGTGWVRQSLDRARVTAAGQVFRMAMYHENHPDGDYEIANQVEVFDEPRAIAWQPGTESPETGELSFGGWIWRYDLEATGPARTTVTLTYDWSAVPPYIREYIQFPPFGQDHLEGSLAHLSDLVA